MRGTIRFIYLSKSSFIVYCFFALSFFVFYHAWKLDLEATKNELESNIEQEGTDGRFFNLNYYQFDKKLLKPTQHLKAKYLTIQNEEVGTTDFVEPRGEAYTQDEREVYYEGDKGKYYKKENRIFLEGNVLLKDAESELRSRTANYEIQNDFFHAVGNIKSKNFSAQTKDKIFVDSDEALSWPKQKIGHYIGNVVGHIQRNRPYEPGIDFKANKILADFNKSYIELIENVYLKKGGLKANSIRGEIFLENYNKKLKYYALYDDVKVVERVPVTANGTSSNSMMDNSTSKGPFIERRAFAEKLEGFVREEKIILTGYPKVIQDKDVIIGNVITLLEKNEVIEVDDSNSSFIIKE